ncbi:MAG: MarR family transcriptional regulator [Clostridia bacterium]|nr:MarR family transcriptional regulator [Clostridia bacterium]
MNIAKQPLSFKLFKAYRRLRAMSKIQLRDKSITQDNYMTMHYIFENPGITQAELADINQKDRNVIGKLIDKLEEKKLVRRERGQKDRRSFCLYLTDAGASAVKKYWADVKRAEKKQINKLSEEEQKTFMVLLEKLTD